MAAHTKKMTTQHQEMATHYKEIIAQQ